ncbi:MAG: fucose isomerase [Planctomycetota bacterium]|jgi:L-fucose isomerase-like protein|nr:fucose isomerase [Planctomycetota bacterium]
MLFDRITIGLAPCRRWREARKTVLFNPEAALAIKKELVAYIRSRYESEEVRFVDLDFLNDEGMMSAAAEAPAIAERFRREGVDAVFIINCNFGSEEAAGMVGKLTGKPVLLWGPRDKIEPDGFRNTDTQCGLFSISKQLSRLGVPFSYIENCRVSAPVFDRGLRRFFSVARMIKNFRGMRVLQIGNRPQPFYSVIYNEGELLERFGIEVIPLNASRAGEELRAIYNDPVRRRSAAESLLAKYDAAGLDPDLVARAGVFLQFYRDAIRAHDCRVVAGECHTFVRPAIGAMPCAAISLLAEEGIHIACETDVLGAVSMGLLGAAAGRGSAPFLGEFTMRHPDDDNVELLWHCGALPYCLKKDDCRPRLQDNTRNELQLRTEGIFTVLRLDSLRGKYHLLAGNCEGAEGPHTYGASFWARFDNLPKWEKRLVEGPYIHHLAEVRGDYLEAVRDFAKYYPEIELDTP